MVQDNNNNNFFNFFPTLVFRGLNKIIIIISASDFLSLLAKKISQRSGDERETAFLFQRVSALVQR